MIAGVGWLRFWFDYNNIGIRVAAKMYQTLPNLTTLNSPVPHRSFQRSNSQDSIFMEHTSRQFSWRNQIQQYSPYLQQTEAVYYVRVPLTALQEHLKLYQWRRSCPNNVAHVDDFYIISRGTVFNPNALIKVSFDSTLRPLCYIHESFTLTRTICLIKQILNGIKSLIEIFAPFVVSDKMILFDQAGNPKIWIMEQHEMNPCSNKQYQKCSENNCLRSMLKVMEAKCLKTRLSFQFFRDTKEFATIQSLMNALIKFEEQNKLFCPTNLKISVSTNPHSSLQFSLNSSKRRKKSKKMSEEMADLHYSMRSIDSSYIIEDGVKKRRYSPDAKNFIRLSLGNNWRYRDASGFISPSMADRKKDSITAASNSKEQTSQKASFVFSETFKQDENIVIKNIPKLPPPASKISWFSSKSNINLEQKLGIIQLEIPAKIPEQLEGSHQISFLDSKKEDQPPPNSVSDRMNPLHIITRNGWSMQIRGLDDSPMKQSYVDGKDIVCQSHKRRLSKLQALGKQVLESVSHDSD